MASIYPRSTKLVVSVILALELLSIIGGKGHASHPQSAPAPLGSHHHSPKLSFSFVPPEDDPQPQTNQAGGKRDQLCNISTPESSVTLLMPPTNQGLTVAEHPTFWVYVPPTSARNVFLKLEDEYQNYHYHTVLPLPEPSGIVGFTLPEAAPALDLNKRFKVSVAVMCGPMLDPSDPVVEGWIQRVEPDSTLIEQPGHSTFEVAALYANQGIWFDALTTLASLRQSLPGDADVIDAWQQLLESVGLETMQDTELLSIAPAS